MMPQIQGGFMTAAPPAPITSPQPGPHPQALPWPPLPGAQLPAEEGLSLGKLWLVIRRRSLWFGLTFALVFTSMGMVTLGQWLLKPQYRGGFRLLVRDPLAEGRQEASSELAALAQVDTSVNVPNLVQVLASPMLLDPLAQQLGLQKGALLKQVTISRSGESDVLDVNLLWDNPEKGTTVIEALAKEYLAYSLRQRKEKLTQGLRFLDEQAPGLQQRVLDLQQQLAVFRRANTMLAPEEQSRMLEGSRAELNAELRSLNQTEAQLQGLLAMVRSGELISPFQSTSVQTGSSTSGGSAQQNVAGNISNNFSPLLDELIQVEGELAKAQATFRADSPLVSNLRARRNRLKPLLQRREQDSILSALQVNRVQQQKVEDQINTLGAEFRRNPELIKSYEALQQRLEVARENLGSYLKARETFRLEVAQSTVPWQVISPPQFVVIPVEPNLGSRLLQALVLGLAAGTAAAYLRDRVDRVYHSNREVEEKLGLPVLAGVPYLPLSVDRPMAESIKELEPEERFGLRESLRSFYQSLRMLRANRTLRVVAITSSAAGEGKTTTSALLGQTLVDMGMKVLLVDADLRRARLHRRLGVDNSRGLSELFGEAPPPLEELYQWVNPNLALLPGGPRLPDPARLLSSPRCAEIITQIRDQQQFDLILFDTPPALELVDPLLIAEHMDGLILLVSLGRIHRDLPPQVVRKVQESNVDLLGVVTNQRVETVTGAAYGYGYGYGYGSTYSRYGDASSFAFESATEDQPLLNKANQAFRSAATWLDGQKPTTEATDDPTERQDNQRG
jgi:capsular exopolysaccharide synthesis family protein